MEVYRYILAFGSNLGNRELNCKQGEEHLSQFGHILRSSEHLYTEPLKSEVFEVEANQEHFLNYIVEWEGSLAPKELYEHIVVIEDRVGHDRSRRWAPRHLDIDLLFVSVFKEGVWESLELAEEKGLHIPHREIAKRTFLLQLLQSFDKGNNLIHTLVDADRAGVEF
jgi:2-amino-4-hydroxy-6-hydroxymethyldihydropteridine diphosphokinase